MPDATWQVGLVDVVILYAWKEYPELFNAASLFSYIEWDVLLTFRSLQNEGSLFFSMKRAFICLCLLMLCLKVSEILGFF